MEADNESTMEDNTANVTNGDLCKFMQQMQFNMEKLTKDIKTEIKNSNDKLGKEIRDGRREMKAEMRTVNKKIDNVKEEMEKLKNTTKMMRRRK